VGYEKKLGQMTAVWQSYNQKRGEFSAMSQAVIHAIGTAIVALLTLTFWNSSVLAGDRVALVIGNSKYTHTSSLANPENDAISMTNTLREAGFSVTKLVNADQGTMKKELLKFGRRLREGNVDAGLFYYAGHGVQLHGENYLVPVNAQILDEDEIDLEAINVNNFLKVMNSSNADINIIILDACRNNPFVGSSRSTSRGLASVDAPKGTYIAYATAPGSVALDGVGQNSPYTKALTAAISSGGGRTIESIFKTARSEVLAVTGEKQVPWETSSITGDFYFHSDQGQPAQNSSSTAFVPTEDTIASKYALAERLDSSAAWRAFLNDYQDVPDNFYVVLAIDALSRLEKPVKQAARHLPMPDIRMRECYTRRFGNIESKLCVSSILGTQSGNTYSGDNLADGNMNTAWVEGDTGDGLGEVLRFSFERPTTINEILIANGYNKSKSTYLKNGRVRSFNVRTSTGFEGDIQVVDSGRFQVLNIPYLGDVNWITLTLTGVHRGTRYRDTAISELRLQ